MPPASLARLRVRACVLVGAAVFMLVSPLHRVLGGKSPYLRDWLLYRDVGVGLVTAEFFVREGTEERAIDRFMVLGETRGPTTMQIRGEAGLHGLCRRLCAALGPGTDLRVRARVATIDGWAEIDDRTIDRCGPVPPHPIRAGTMPRRLHD
mgnify:CR=1 FL=1